MVSNILHKTQASELGKRVYDATCLGLGHHDEDHDEAYVASLCFVLVEFRHDVDAASKCEGNIPRSG